VSLSDDVADGRRPEERPRRDALAPLRSFRMCGVHVEPMDLGDGVKQ
jgi:hypothetical protein